MWEESLGTQAGVHLIEGVHLIWGPLNTGFTVLDSVFVISRIIKVSVRVIRYVKRKTLLQNSDL